MKQYHKNPRKITDAQLQQLKENIQELGDLSGIVHDLNTDEIISGNQRSKVININECEIEIVKQYDEPNEQGTIAFGFIIFENQRLNYRQVRWNDKQREKACITANALGGDWDYKILEKFEDFDLVDWGLNCDFLKREQWEQLPEVTGDIADPELNKPIKITITIPFENSDCESEVRETIKKH